MRQVSGQVIAGLGVLLGSMFSVAVYAQTPAVASSAAAGKHEAVCDQNAPCITPGTDVDIDYELTSPQNGSLLKQRMRWQVATLRQRIDPEGNALFMLTSWPDHTLTVVDLVRHTQSVMPAPSHELTPPGHPAMMGHYARLGSSVVAGEHCTLWRTKDSDGFVTDACYTTDGLLLQVSRKQKIMVQAVRVDRAAQPDSIFRVPEGFSKVAPATP